MKVLIIGSGGREHAMAWQCAKFDSVEKVFVAPGNAGTALEKKLINIDIGVEAIDELVEFAKNKKIDLTIVGPEAPLVIGIVDYFQANGLTIFGPTKAASQLEGSKSFCKDFLSRNKIPTATYKIFDKSAPAIEYIKNQSLPIVIKTDGLAAGKGVIIANTQKQAIKAINDMLEENYFGVAGNKIVIEEFLVGEELSFIAMVDENNVLPMATSQDHKARDNNDKGPNTGGMGAYSPVTSVNNEILQNIMNTIIYPTVDKMKEQGMTYTGFLYAGLMINNKGKAKVLEYNCRLGDPETQPILLRLKSNLANLCLLAANNKLNDANIKWDDRAALGVVLAADGYPGDYKKDQQITLPDDTENTKIFHAGTKLVNNKILSNGGRVLCATALGKDVKSAKDNAYKLVNKIDWQGCYYRDDIGFKAIKPNTED
jgi:phosphoribosylamine--glycine ligase